MTGPLSCIPAARMTPEASRDIPATSRRGRGTAAPYSHTAPAAISGIQILNAGRTRRVKGNPGIFPARSMMPVAPRQSRMQGPVMTGPLVVNSREDGRSTTARSGLDAHEKAALGIVPAALRGGMLLARIEEGRPPSSTAPRPPLAGGFRGRGVGRGAAGRGRRGRGGGGRGGRRGGRASAGFRGGRGLRGCPRRRGSRCARPPPSSRASPSPSSRPPGRAHRSASAARAAGRRSPAARRRSRRAPSRPTSAASFASLHRPARARRGRPGRRRGSPP